MPIPNTGIGTYFTSSWHEHMTTYTGIIGIHSTWTGHVTPYIICQLVNPKEKCFCDTCGKPPHKSIKNLLATLDGLFQVEVFTFRYCTILVVMQTTWCVTAMKWKLVQGATLLGEAQQTRGLVWAEKQKTSQKTVTSPTDFYKIQKENNTKYSQVVTALHSWRTPGGRVTGLSTPAAPPTPPPGGTTGWPR